MKRIAIFCDGTWNRPKDDTNVNRLCKLLAQTDADGNIQERIYVRGVGARDQDGFIAKAIDRVGGGAFGWGLTENIEEAYRELIKVYEVGDKIYLFGFSRGAYTARSLAGLIRNCGLPTPDTVGSIPEAIRLYRERSDDSKPDEPRSLRFRADFSPLVATSAEDLNLRINPGQCHQLQIAYQGIWDTVGALGVPNHITGLAKLFNKRYKFHDAELSSSVTSARHAIAIDEKRRTYPPVKWSNLPRLNAENPPDQPGGAPRYQQLWFPGVHGAVGGSSDLRGLGDATLYWIAKGAELCGLRFEPNLENIPTTIDPSSPVAGTKEPPNLFWRLLALDSRARTELETAQEVSRLARRRLFLDPSPDDWAGSRLPETLNPVIDELRMSGAPGPEPDQ